MQTAPRIVLDIRRALALLAVCAVAFAVVVGGPLPKAQAATTQDTSVCVVVRVSVSLVPGSEKGSYQVDSAKADVAQRNTDAICKAVTASQNVKVTLAVSPLLLEYWTSAKESGNQQATQLLSDLADAQATDRLELVTLGYGDPNLSTLANAGYSEDIAAQYSETTSSDLAAAFTLSTGTVPAGLTFNDSDADKLTDAGISWTAVDTSLMSGETNSIVSGIFSCRSQKNLLLLGVDTASAALFSANTAEDAVSFLQQLQTSGIHLPGNTYATVVEVGAGSTTTTGSNVARVLTTISSLSGYGLSCASDAVETAANGYDTPPSVKVDGDGSNFDSPLIEALGQAQGAVASLRNMLYSTNSTYDTAEQQLLVSESAFFDNSNTAAELARNISVTTSAAYHNLSIGIEDMVLAGKSGSIPFTVYNTSDSALKVTLTFNATGGASVTDSEYANGYTTVLYTGENTFSVPVECDADGGSLSVAVTSGNTVIAQDGAAVHTSSINTVTLVVCALILVGVVVFVVRRRHRRNSTPVE